MAITAATRSTPAAIPSAKSPVFYSWGTLPFTTQTAQQTSALRVTRSSGTATVVVTSTTLTVNDGSDHAFTLASYSTVTALAAAITALGNGWTATVLNTLGRLPASQLVTRSLVSCSAANIDLLMQGTADGDALLIHPNHRIMAKIGCQSATIDYFLPPGATTYGFHYDGPSDSQIVARFADWQQWQGLSKSDNSAIDSRNYDNGVSFNGLTRRPDFNSVILGSEEDALASTDRAAMDAIYGPYLRYTPFAANSILSLYSKFAGLALALKAECDSRNVKYPAFVADDIENNDGFLGGCGLWEWIPETANIADGSPNYLDFGRGRGSLLHGKPAFNLYVTGSSGADPGSFTTFTASVDTRTIYVSNSAGSDSNDGLSSGAPKKTIAAGVALMRNGYPDWLLLKCGDTWTNEVITTNWLLSGRSSSEKMLIGTYGSGNRPLLLLTDKSGFRRQGGGAAPTTISHIALVGIEFREYNHTPTDTSTMISLIKQVQDFLIEDVVCNGGGEGLLVQGESNTVRHQDVTINRCMFVNANSTKTDPRTQGMYAAYTNNLVITDCLFDNNGYPTSDIFCHNIYIDANCGPTIIERNYIMRPCANGIQARSGGTMRWNIFADCPIAALSSNGNGTVTGQGVNTCDYNVIVSGEDISPSSLRGNGFDLQSFVSGSCKYNIIGQKTSTNTNTGAAISLSNSAVGAPFQNAEIAYNIIRNWYAGIVVDENNGTWTYSGVTIHDNTLDEIRGATGTYLQWRLRFSTWAGITYSNNLYSHATTSTPFVFGGSNKSFAQWVTSSGETGASFASSATSSPLVPTIAAAINAIKGTSFTTTAEVGAYLLSRARGTWDSAINGKAVFDWYNVTCGGSAPTGGINTSATITIAPFKYLAGVATNGSISLNGSPVLTLTATTTISEVLAAINAVSGFAATIASGASPSDLFYGTSVTSFVIGAYSDSANPYYFWTTTWPRAYYRGWLQYLIDEPTLADIARRSTETIYQELVSGVWTNRTFDWWWTNVVQAEGLDNFPRTASTSQSALSSAFTNNRLDYAPGQDQNQKQRIVINNASGGTFTLSFGGQTTSNITYNAASNLPSAATVQSALTALSSIGSGQVTVTKPHNEYFLVEMTGTFALTTKALFTADASHLATISGSPSITISEAVRAVTRGTNWLSAAVDTGLAPNVGRTQREFTTGFASTSTLTKANAFYHLIHSLYFKCIAYRLAQGILSPLQSVLPGVQFANDYGSAFGLRPTFFPTGGSSNPNFGFEMGATPCLSVAPTCYRPYILDDYSQDYGKPWRPGSYASTMSGGLVWTDALITALRSPNTGQVVCPWLAEPGLTLSNTNATWIQTSEFLQTQLNRFINAGRTTSACTFHHFFLYCDPSTFSEGAVSYGYRSSTLSTVDSSDRSILAIITACSSFATLAPTRRRR